MTTSIITRELDYQTGAMETEGVEERNVGNTLRTLHLLFAANPCFKTHFSIFDGTTLTVTLKMLTMVDLEDPPPP
jgi:hypothetical protein